VVEAEYSGGGGAGGFRICNSYLIPGCTTSPLASNKFTSFYTSLSNYSRCWWWRCWWTWKCTLGSNSIFSTITSAGGGGGGGGNPGAGLAGGSGGGSGGGGVLLH
jgi:hypothetical protein